MAVDRSNQSSYQLANGVTDCKNATDGTILSVTAAVKEYERLQSELSRLSAQSQQLRTRRNTLKSTMEQFMRERNLSSLKTRSGNMVVRFVERSNRVGPGKKATEACIQQALGAERSDLAAQLIKSLYETNKVKRQVTHVETSS